MGKTKAAPAAEPVADDKTEKTDTPTDDKAKPEAPKSPEPASPAPDEGDAPAPDVDDTELLEAQAALKEESGEGKEGEPSPEGDKDTKPEGDKPPAEPDPAPAAADKGDKEPAKPDAEPAKDEMVTIPKPRLDAEIGKREKAERTAAYWQGVAEANLQAAQNQGAKPEGPQPPQKSPDEIIVEARAQQEVISKQLDDGEIDTVEWTKQNAALDDAIYAAREANWMARVPGTTAPQPVAPAGDSLTLDQLTVQLEEAHPIVHELVEDDWAIVGLRARQELAADGITLTPDARQPDDRIEYAFRRKKAEVADVLGPTLIKARGGNPLPDPQPGEDPPQPATPDGGLSPTAANRAKKLDAAAAAPPDTSNLGTPGAADAVTDAAVEGMTDDEIMDLPAPQRRKFMPE